VAVQRDQLDLLDLKELDLLGRKDRLAHLAFQDLQEGQLVLLVIQGRLDHREYEDQLGQLVPQVQWQDQLGQLDRWVQQVPKVPQVT
jgi:hypothetical protein